jgi:hypothetical protein
VFRCGLYTYDVGTPHWQRRVVTGRYIVPLPKPAFPTSPCHMTANTHPHTPLPPPRFPSFAPLHMGLVSLCICNRIAFIKQPSLRSAYGCCAHPIRSNSTVSISTWRHAALSQRFRPTPIAASHTHLTVRAASWTTKFNLRRSGSSSDSDAHEEGAKDSVLEAIKGRQQTDLMLRCESESISQQALRFIST